MSKKYKGDLEDNRKVKDRLKDYQAFELDLGGGEVVSKKEAIKNAKAYTSRNQFSKSSCVCASICNALWATEGETLADEFLYTLRSNKPGEGCYWHDIADKVKQLGICRRSEMKEVKTEAEANAISPTEEQYKNAKIHRQDSYVYVNNFNQLVNKINKGTPVVFSIFATGKEWGQEVPKIIDTKLTIETAPINHAICAIPNTWYQEKGEDYFIITDSAHFGKRYIRHISKTFFDTRFKHGLYFNDLFYVETKKWITPPEFKGYKFTRDLTIGSTGKDVKDLQAILLANGYFPIEKPTGYYGSITAKAVKDFQADYPSIWQSIGLTNPTGIFGNATRNKLNELIK